MDDTLVKSTKCHTHLQDLAPILGHMEKFSLNLNTNKYTLASNQGNYLDIFSLQKELRWIQRKFKQLWICLHLIISVK